MSEENEAFNFLKPIHNKIYEKYFQNIKDELD